jgi:hypothetical protein
LTTFGPPSRNAPKITPALIITAITVPADSGNVYIYGCMYRTSPDPVETKLRNLFILYVTYVGSPEVSYLATTSWDSSAK